MTSGLLLHKEHKFYWVLHYSISDASFQEVPNYGQKCFHISQSLHTCLAPSTSLIPSTPYLFSDTLLHLPFPFHATKPTESPTLDIICQSPTSTLTLWQIRLSYYGFHYFHLSWCSSSPHSNMMTLTS